MPGSKSSGFISPLKEIPQGSSTSKSSIQGKDTNISVISKSKKHNKLSAKSNQSVSSLKSEDTSKSSSSEYLRQPKHSEGNKKSKSEKEGRYSKHKEESSKSKIVGETTNSKEKEREKSNRSKDSVKSKHRHDLSKSEVTEERANVKDESSKQKFETERRSKKGNTKNKENTLESTNNEGKLTSPLDALIVHEGCNELANSVLSITQTEFNKYPTATQLHSTINPQSEDIKEEIKSEPFSPKCPDGSLNANNLVKLESMLADEKVKFWDVVKEEDFEDNKTHLEEELPRHRRPSISPIPVSAHNSSAVQRGLFKSREARKSPGRRHMSPISPIKSQPFVSPISSPLPSSQQDLLTPSSRTPSSPGNSGRVVLPPLMSWAGPYMNKTKPAKLRSSQLHLPLPPKTPPPVETYKTHLSPVSEVSTEEECGNGRKLSQDCQRSRPPKGSTQREKLLWIQRNRCVGVWVQCCNKECEKWRYLKEVLDPVEIPEKWFCSMNKDVRYNSCSKQMCPYFSGKELINVLFTSGTVVWAKLAGYPRWPAMVDDDPEFAHFYWLPASKSKTPVQYHVTFFDSKEVTRAWLPKQMIEPFKEINRKSKEKVALRYQKRLNFAVAEATKALAMPLPERIVKYSFVSRYKGHIYSYKHNIHEFVAKHNLPPYQDSSSSEEDETADADHAHPGSRRRFTASLNRSLTETSLHEISMEVESLVREAREVGGEGSSSSLSPNDFKQDDISPEYNESEKEEESQDQSQLTMETRIVEAELHKRPRTLSTEPKVSILPSRNEKVRKTYGKKNQQKDNSGESSLESLIQMVVDGNKRSKSPSWSIPESDQLHKKKIPRSPRTEAQRMKKHQQSHKTQVTSIFSSPSTSSSSPEY